MKHIIQEKSVVSVCKTGLLRVFIVCCNKEKVFQYLYNHNTGIKVKLFQKNVSNNVKRLLS